MRVTVRNGSVEIIHGDITDETTDAIVNAANNLLWMGGGVAGAIKRKGGRVIEEEAISLGPIEVGRAVATGAGTLKSKYVIHAAVMGQNLSTSAELIKTATLSSLKLAEDLRLTSISIPALGTGVGGFSVFHCAKIMLTETLEFLLDSTYLHDVRFVLFDAEVRSAFEGELELQFSSKRH